jgi:hypothetical protein
MAAAPLWLMQQGAEAAGLEGASKFLGQGSKYFRDSAEEKRRGLSADAKLSNGKEFVTKDDEGGFTRNASYGSDQKPYAPGRAEIVFKAFLSQASFPVSKAKDNLRAISARSRGMCAGGRQRRQGV